MARFTPTRLIPIALVLIIVIVAIAALVSLTRAVFFSGSATPATTKVDTSESALLSTDPDRSVRLTVRGPIVADESFHSYQITITPSSRSLSTYTGYLDAQVDGVTLGNNTPAYTQFVYALDKANLVKGKALSDDKNDTRGVCATGRVYQFDVMKDGTSIKNLWTSTCSGSTGSLDANVSQLTNLFDAQIPTAQALIRKITLQ